MSLPQRSCLGPRPAVGAQREPAILERGEHVPDRGLDLSVGIDHDVAGVVVDQPDRQRGAQLAALGRGPLVRVQPLGHHVELHLSHGPLEPQLSPLASL